MRITPKKSNTIHASATAVTQDADLSTGAEDRQRSIANAAYFKAESRGFEPGQDLRDWLEAEAEFDRQRRH